MLPVVGRLTAPRDVHIFSVCGRKDTADVIKDLEEGSLLWIMQVGRSIHRGPKKQRTCPDCGVCVSHWLVSDSSTPWTAALQAPLSVGSSRQENWGGLPFPPPGRLWREGHWKSVREVQFCWLWRRRERAAAKGCRHPLEAARSDRALQRGCGPVLPTLWFVAQWESGY